MSSDWSGFTDEDLKQIRGRFSPDLTRLSSHMQISDESKHGRTLSVESMFSLEEKKSAFPKKPTSRSKAGILKPNCQTKNDNLQEIPLTPEQSLSNYLSTVSGSPRHAVLKVDSTSKMFEVVGIDSENITDETQKMNARERYQVDVPVDPEATSQCTCTSSNYEEEEITAVSIKSSQEKVTLERFEEKRKQMEAENAKRKKMLLEALDDRKKRTREEAKKIAKIQMELNKLDSVLSCDVGILRNQIETASLEFTTAQKRYEKAEKEFVEAKYALFQKLERKEQLTDYLCTIIEQNEARKANKLADLMKELELDSLLENNQSLETLPSPCVLNGMAMSHCSVAPASQVPPHADVVACTLNTNEPDDTSE